MSSSQDNSQKNSKVPNRPHGVQKADEEHTGFLKYNKNEKDPLIELFDTLQTVKDKNEQNKENTAIHSQHTVQSSKPSLRSYFSKKWILTLIAFPAIGLVSWIYFQNFFNFNIDLNRDLSSVVDKPESTPQVQKNITPPQPPTTSAQLKQNNNTFLPTKSNSLKGGALKAPDRKNQLGTPLPEKGSQKSGGFFPSEDPGYDDSSKDQNEEDSNPPQEDATMDDLDEDAQYDQEEDVSSKDPDDSTTTADDGNPEDAENPKSKKKRNRKKASQPY